MRHVFLVLFAVLLGGWVHGLAVPVNTWLDLPEGAGGYQTSMDMASDGTAVVRCDVFGAYILNTTLGNAAVWQNVVNSISLPAAYWNGGTGTNNGGTYITNIGVYEIRFAPSNSNIIYMEYGGYLWASSNKGASWNGPYSLVGGGAAGSAANGYGANDSYRLMSQKIAVDPNNAYLVIVGTPTSGIFSVNFAGDLTTAPTVTKITALPTPGAGGYEGIAFDPASGTTGGNTNTIYVVPYGDGLYVSIDAGTTWGQATAGGASIAHYGKVYGGVYYVSDESGHLYSYTGGASGSWATIITGVGSAGGYQIAFDFDPFVANRMVAISNCRLNVSIDAGTTWSGWTTNCSMTATDIPWQAELSNAMQTTAMFFDLNTQNKLWASGSNDHWHITISTINTGVSPAWISQGVGIEELVSLQVVVPPGGGPLLTQWDRALFQQSYPYKSFPATQAMAPSPQAYLDVNAGWAIDYASSNSSFVVIVASGTYAEVGDCTSFNCIFDSYSTNGGASWTLWPTRPANYPQIANSGSIAVSTTTNWVYWPAQNNSYAPQPWYTTDGASTWSLVSLANPALGATTGTGLSSPTTTGAPISGSATMTVGSCSKAVAGESIYDNTVGATLGQIISCSSTTLTLNQNAPSESYGATDALYFFGVPDIQNTAATASWTTSNNTISVAACTNIFAGELVFDSTLASGNTSQPKEIGTVSSCSATTLTLTGNASASSSGSTDSLWFSAWGEGGNNPSNAGYVLAADRVNTGTFYLCFCTGTLASYTGIYVTTNGGASWTFAANITLGSTSNSLQATPGEAGDLWFCTGPNNGATHHPASSGVTLYHSANSGSTWSDPSSGHVQECLALGFGAPKTSGYPTVYAAAWCASSACSGTCGATYCFGIYRSADEGITWSQVCDAVCSQYPLNSIAEIHSISGDMYKYGAIFVGMQNNGFAWGIFPYLLRRDLDPASNDNSPVGLDRAA